jgi:WD40 repeat protein
MEFPTELLIPVFQALTVREIGQAAACCKQFAAAARSDKLWGWIGRVQLSMPDTRTHTRKRRRGLFRSAVQLAVQEPRDWVWRGLYNAVQRFSRVAGAAKRVFCNAAVADSFVVCGSNTGELVLFPIAPSLQRTLAVRAEVAIRGFVLLGAVVALALERVSESRYELVASGTSGALVVADIDASSLGDGAATAAVAHHHVAAISCVLLPPYKPSPPPSSPSTFAVVTDGTPSLRLAITGDQEGRACLWDWSSKTALALWSPHTACITAIAWSPPGSDFAAQAGGILCASASFDATVALWDVRPATAAALRVEDEIQAVAGHDQAAPSLLCRATLPASCYRVYSLVWSDSGALLAVACGDGTVRLLCAVHEPRVAGAGAALAPQEDLAGSDLGRFALVMLRALPCASSWIRGVAFLCSGRAVAAAGGDGRVRMWDCSSALKQAAEAAAAAARQAGVSAASSLPPPPCAYLGTLDIHAGSVLGLASRGDTLASVSLDESLVVRRYVRRATGLGRFDNRDSRVSSGGHPSTASSGIFRGVVASRMSRHYLSRASWGVARAPSGGALLRGRDPSYSVMDDLVFNTAADGPPSLQPLSLAALVGSCDDLMGGADGLPAFPAAASPLLVRTSSCGVSCSVYFLCLFLDVQSAFVFFV